MKCVEFLTLIISLIGAGAWIPSIINLLRRNRIYGKMISRYNNCNDNDTFFLFKLSILIENKDFNLKDIECEIEFEDGQILKSTALNMRKITFNKNEELTVSGINFLNNISVLNCNKNQEGYLFFKYGIVKPTTKIIKTKFIFIDYKNKKKYLTFVENEIESKKLFYDDSIWKQI